MRALADAARIRRFLAALGAEADAEARLYLTGGATAVLHGWRSSTVDIDYLLVPETDRLLRAIPRLKEELHVNVEPACPAHFIPPLPGWEERSRFVCREGRLTVLHYDPYAQALAKVERGHRKDLDDVRALVSEGLVEPARARELFSRIEPELYRYPAIDPGEFRRQVDAAFPPP